MSSFSRNYPWCSHGEQSVLMLRRWERQRPAVQNAFLDAVKPAAATQVEREHYSTATDRPTDRRRVILRNTALLAVTASVPLAATDKLSCLSVSSWSRDVWRHHDRCALSCLVCVCGLLRMRAAYVTARLPVLFHVCDEYGKGSAAAKANWRGRLY